MASERLAWIETDLQEAQAGFAESVRAGLTAQSKTLSCKWLYDEEGSRLFEEICAQPEYYPTRAELEILTARAPEIASDLRADADLVELGSGSSLKTRTLIEAALARHGRLRYVPLDISHTMLEASACELLEDYPSLEMLCVAAEYGAGLRVLRRRVEGPKLILWLGSNVGNFERAAAGRFLAELRGGMGSDDRLILGVDLRKDRRVLEAAYDDAAGVTARFNLNLLTRINRALDADFDSQAFEHRARYDESLGRVEMHLVSRRAQRVRIEALDLEIELEVGEAIHTENSYKYSEQELDDLAAAGSLRTDARWFDEARRFSLQRLAPLE